MRIVFFALVLVLIDLQSGRVLAQKDPVACHEPSSNLGTVRLKTPLGELTGIVCLDDGDSFSVGPVWVRLAGIDAPNIPRNCLKKFPGMPGYCQTATESLAQLGDILDDGGATCDAAKHDGRYRWLAKCTTPAGLDVASELVRRGFACAAIAFPEGRLYVEVQNEAKSGAKGLWSEQLRSQTRKFPTKYCFEKTLVDKLLPKARRSRVGQQP